jgi:ribosomal protein L40E
MDGTFNCRGTLEVGKGLVIGSWHFARMAASSDRLTVSAPVAGELVFRPEDVLTIKAFRVIPFLYRGVAIRHTIDDYPRVIRFRSFLSPDAVIAGIAQAGFTPTANEEDVCLDCGHHLPVGADTCRHCGWTYANRCER